MTKLYSSSHRKYNKLNNYVELDEPGAARRGPLQGDRFDYKNFLKYFELAAKECMHCVWVVSKNLQYIKESFAIIEHFTKHRISHICDGRGSLEFGDEFWFKVHI